ncbi:MAG: HAD hydrolase family protein [Chloroflexota bacterium]
MTAEKLTWVIFSDVDGTLTDAQTYRWEAAAGALRQVMARPIPLVLCSSKTRQELEYYRRLWHIPDPFIVENGSAIFVPPAYFPFAFPYQREANGYQVIELGAPAEAIWLALASIRRQTGLTLEGYRDLTPAEVGRLTGLAPVAARRARQREYSETIVTPLAAEQLAQLQAHLAEMGLAITAGDRFYTITSAASDKGQAVTLLTELFQRKLGHVITVGIGDAANDLPLLAAVDRPYLVQQFDGRWLETAGRPVERVAGVGPAGWAQVIHQLIHDD